MTDLLIEQAAVYDGLGGEPYAADVAVTGDRIEAVGDLGPRPAARTISGAGLALAPGFIDVHTHSDFSILGNPLLSSSVAQGVTTEVVGNCGTSVGLIDGREAFAQERRWVERSGQKVDWDGMGAYLTRLDSAGIGINVATLVGHGTIRRAVMGFDNRPPTQAELSEMLRMLEAGLDAGAVGVSTGLEYLPGGFAAIPEQVALVRLAAQAGGFYATHIRNEGDRLVESIQEAITVAEEAGCPLQLSHHKAEGQRNWGIVAKTLGMMEAARGRGMDVLTDQYPYIAYMTGLTVVLLPAWAQEGASGDVLERLTAAETRRRVLDEIEQEGRDWDTIKIGIARNRPDTQGLSLRELGAREHKSPAEAAIDLLIDEECWVGAANFAMSEADVETIMRSPYTMVGSDGVGQDAHTGDADRTHPRTFGTFPRVLGEYVRERGVLTLQEAVRRMTSLPAKRLRLSDRGVLRAGAKADLVLFDPKTVSDRATFDEPRQYPAGIEKVFVNGSVAFENGAPTGARTGRVLRRPT